MGTQKQGSSKRQRSQKGGTGQGRPGNGAGAPSTRIVLYGLDEGTERGDAVRQVITSAGIAIRTATTEELAEPVGALAGLKGFKKTGKPYSGDVPEEPFMLLCGIQGMAMDQLLEALRQAGCPVAHKAVVTQYNRLWPFHKLIEQIALEHSVMTGTEA